MGVFDFAKEAGAKVGLGDSKEDKAEKAAAASADAAKAASAKLGKRQADARKRAAATAEVKAKAAEEEAAAEAKARADDGKRADNVERHLTRMGLGDYNVKVVDDAATVIGEADTQEAKEKAIIAIGNIQGIATVRDFIRVAKAEPESTLYTVQSGDSLSKIAKEVYGDPMKYPDIFEANKPMLTDPDLIFPGQVLRIPAAS